jgi:hypothetical protein
MGTQSPIRYGHDLKRYGSEPFYIGHTPSVAGFEPNAFFKGELADIKMWNRALEGAEVELLHKQYSTNGLALHYNFDDIENGYLIDQSELNDGFINNVTFEDLGILSLINPLLFEKSIPGFKFNI